MAVFSFIKVEETSPLQMQQRRVNYHGRFELNGDWRNWVRIMARGAFLAAKKHFCKSPNLWVVVI